MYLKFRQKLTKIASEDLTLFLKKKKPNFCAEKKNCIFKIYWFFKDEFGFFSQITPLSPSFAPSLAAIVQ